jgi:hypothetical protein
MPDMRSRMRVCDKTPLERGQWLIGFLGLLGINEAHFHYMNVDFASSDADC